MGLIQSQGNWEQFTTKLRSKYPQLTEADLFSADNNESDIMRMIEYKLGITTIEFQEIIAGL
jgi:hypothetical protein